MSSFGLLGFATRVITQPAPAWGARQGRLLLAGNSSLSTSSGLVGHRREGDRGEVAGAGAD